MIQKAIDMDEILKELAEVKQLLGVLIERQTVKEYYEVGEFAKVVGKTEYTVREWCRLCRINAAKRQSGRAGKMGWVISHDEYLRYQREGLIPLSRPQTFT